MTWNPSRVVLAVDDIDNDKTDTFAPFIVALYCTYCTYARTVLTYDLSYTYCTYIPYSYSPSRILNPDTVYVDASQLQATSFTFLANVVSFAFSSLLTYLVTNTSSFSALQPLARPSPHFIYFEHLYPNLNIRHNCRLLYHICNR